MTLAAEPTLAVAGILTPQELEQALGNPNDPTNPTGCRRLSALDSTGELPTAALDVLNRLRVCDHYIPLRDGGELRDYAQLLGLVRTIARRDVTLAVAHGSTFLGASATWVRGSLRQRAWLASVVSAGKPVSCALTERAHGADLLSGDTRAELDHTGRLTGEKWLINNASRADVISVLARTAPSGGPRGFGIVLVENGQPGYQPTPKIDTHGLRGARISGFHADGVSVADDHVVTATKGIDATLLGLQLTRVLCGGLSLGAGDHALAHVVSSIQQSSGATSDIQAELARCYADQLLNEAVATMVARSMHALPAELSLHAAVAKYLIPTRTERMIRRLRRLSRPAAALSDSVLDKIERDNRVVSLFDGNTVVNLAQLIGQFGAIGRQKSNPIDPSMRLCHNAVERLPELDPDQLSLASRTGSTYLNTLAGVITEIEHDRTAFPVMRYVRQVQTRIDELTVLAGDVRTLDQRQSSNAFALAEQIAAAIGAAMCIHLWWGTRKASVAAQRAELWSSGTWLDVVLRRLLPVMGASTRFQNPVADEALVADLLDCVTRRNLPSLFEFRISGADSGTPV